MAKVPYCTALYAATIKGLESGSLMACVAAVPLLEFDRSRAIQALAVICQSGGKERPVGDFHLGPLRRRFCYLGYRCRIHLDKVIGRAFQCGSRHRVAPQQGTSAKSTKNQDSADIRHSKRQLANYCIDQMRCRQALPSIRRSQEST